MEQNNKNIKEQLLQQLQEWDEKVNNLLDEEEGKYSNVNLDSPEVDEMYDSLKDIINDERKRIQDAEDLNEGSQLTKDINDSYDDFVRFLNNLQKQNTVFNDDDDKPTKSEEGEMKPRLTDKEIEKYKDIKWDFKCKGSLFFKGHLYVEGVQAKHVYKHLGWWPFKFIGWRGFVRTEVHEVDLRDVVFYNYGDGDLYFGSDDDQIEAANFNSGDAKKIYNLIEEVANNFAGEGEIIKSTVKFFWDILLFPIMFFLHMGRFLKRERFIMLPQGFLFVRPKWRGRDKYMLNYKDVNFITNDKKGNIVILGKLSIFTKYPFDSDDVQILFERLKDVLAKDSKSYTPGLYGSNPVLIMCKDVVLFEDGNEISVLKYEDIDGYVRKKTIPLGLLGYGKVLIHGKAQTIKKKSSDNIVTIEMPRVHAFNWRFLYMAWGIRSRLNGSAAHNKGSVRKELLNNA